MNNPLISIVMPSYNHARYVEKSILSVVNQSYKNIELIVIDDGSTDDSPAILKKLQEQYGFYLEFQSNQGVSRTLNKAISYAKGKYISLIASDDVWMEGRLEKQVKFMETHSDCSVVVGKVLYIDEKDRVRDDITIFLPILDPGKQLSFEGLIEGNYIPAGTTMYLKEAWQKCGGYNENLSVEDWDFWLKVAFECKIDYLDEYLSYYRRHESNVSNDILKVYTEARKIVYSWKDKMDSKLAQKILPRRDSLTFCVLARKYKKESFRYLHFPTNYIDGYMIKNYLKGFFKLIFYW